MQCGGNHLGYGRALHSNKRQTFSPAACEWDMWHTDIPSTHTGRGMCQLVAISRRGAWGGVGGEMVGVGGGVMW